MNGHAAVSLARYLEELAPGRLDFEDSAAMARAAKAATAGRALHEAGNEERRRALAQAFQDWVRTEEVKAWYGEPEGDSLFQGTSVSSLTIPCRLPEPLRLSGIAELEEAIADHYVRLHDAHAPAARRAIVENTDKWMAEGLYYGIVVGSKMISQAFGLTVPDRDVVFAVDGVTVDPHEITSYAPEVRRRYFEACRERITCFAEVPGFAQAELEASLVLADISKPRIEAYRNRLMLGPIRCNEVAALISRHVTRLVREKTGGRIAPRSLMVTIYDTDTPYTYHQIAGYYGRALAPTLPGLAVLGASGSVDAFRWLYAYRVSLVAQKLMKSSIHSETARSFVPFVCFGVLVERDAEILLDLDHLGRLRYRGNLSPYLEYCCLLPRLARHLDATSALDLDAEIETRTR